MGNDNLATCAEEFQQAIVDENYSRTELVEIFEGSKITADGQIDLVAYLHDSAAECDVSFPCFSYDEQHRCWIIKKDSWGAPNGFDCNGTVSILDFSGYR